MKNLFKIIIIAIVVFIIAWLCSQARCEYLTKKYYNDFEFAYKETNVIDDVEFFKVLSCDEKNARVYYVSKDYGMGNVFVFEKKDEQWMFSRWENLYWTNLGGNADNIVWPYWWHFIYKK